MRRTILLVALGVAVLALAEGTALATPPSGQTVTPITKGTLGTFKAEGNGIVVDSQQSSSDIAIAKVDLKPGGHTGWHHLPGLTLASVASGTVAVYDVNCEKIVVTAGEGFVEHRNEPRLVKNNGNVNATLYTTLIAPTDLLALPFEEVRRKRFAATTHSQATVTSLPPRVRPRAPPRAPPQARRPLLALQRPAARRRLPIPAALSL